MTKYEHERIDSLQAELKQLWTDKGQILKVAKDLETQVNKINSRVTAVLHELQQLATTVEVEKAGEWQLPVCIK